ncbi:MAG: protein translocase subunit SecD [Nitrospirota bacterium]
MKRRIGVRLAVIAATVVVSAVLFLPSTPWYQSMPDWWKRWLPSQGVTLGLDLLGGMHVVLAVEAEKAVEGAIDRTLATLPGSMATQQLSGVTAERVGPFELALLYPSDEAKDTLTAFMDDGYPMLYNVDRVAPAEGRPGRLIYRVREGDQARIKDSAITQALETIRNRVDQFGVAEPLIQRQAANEILVQLPGIKEPQRALELIGKTAQLEFKLVSEESPAWSKLPARVPPSQEEAIAKETAAQLAPDEELLYERIVDPETGEARKAPYILKRTAVLTGDLLTDARVTIGQFNESQVSITFNSMGAELFKKATTEHVKKRLAIVLDNTVYSAPVIQEPISGGRAQITGNFTTQEANDLAIVLRAGALPAPVRIIQNVTVGPTLGHDSIEAGVKAALLGAALVLLFMAVYYRLAGVIADLALILNIVLLVGALAAFNATLTLPGIAGIILTIGMAVDSNVLIFERIREELRQQRPVRLAIDAGYEKAFVTIIDSHVTTLITAVVLFLLGTGPIKGFAVTLSLGVTINLFSSIVGTRVIFDWIGGRRKLETLSI